MRHTQGTKLLSVLLTLAMLLSLVPSLSLTAFAVPTCPNPGCRSTNIAPLGDTWECQDCGYIFESPSDGDESDDHNPTQYKNTTTVLKFDDKDWYLIDYDDDTVTLLSKECVGASAFDPNGLSNTYSGSTVESFVNNWYSDNITSDAKAAVNGSGMFLLTTDQANGLSSDVLKCTQASGAEMNFWWLCSPGTNDEDCAVFGVYGEDGEDVTECSVVWVFGVRPALKLDLSKVEFNSEKTFELAAPAEDGPLVGTVIKVGDTLTLDGDYIEYLPGASGQVTESKKLVRMEYDEYSNGWGFIFESGAFLIAGDETPEPDGFYVSGGNGTQSHPYTLALHYASAEPETPTAPAAVSFVKVTDADQIAVDNIGECTFDEAKAWVYDNWDSVTAGVGNAPFIAIVYIVNGSARMIFFQTAGCTDKDEFKALIESDSDADLDEIKSYYNSGYNSGYDFVYVCSKAAAPAPGAYAGYLPAAADDATALAAKVVKFNGHDWYLIEDNSTSETEGTVTLFAAECVGASAFNSIPSNTYSGSTVETYVNNWYTSNISADAKAAVNGSGMFLLTTDQAQAITNTDVLKCSQASGAAGNYWWLCSPGTVEYTLACVDGEDGNMTYGGDDVNDVFGVRPALQLDLSKVTFDSATNTFSVGSVSKDPVSYMAWDETEKKPVEKTGDDACTDYTVVTADTSAFEDGKWYVVNSDVTVSSRIDVSGTANLILCDGATLTASAGVNASGATLNIYGQSAGTGALIANAANGSDSEEANGGIGGNGVSGNVTVNGGTVTATGGNGGNGEMEGGNGGNGVSGNVTVNGGTVTATGGNGGNSLENGGIGGNGVSGNVTVNGGTVTATGGNGGGGAYSDGGSGVSGNVTVNGGTVTATGGNGGSGFSGGDGGSGISGNATVNNGTVTATGGVGGQGHPQFGSNGSIGKAITGTITGAGVESDDGNTWSAVSGNTSEKQYVVIDGTALHTHDDITFTAWESTNSLPTEAGNYYLTGNVKLDNTWFAPNGTTNLCLDGHSIGCAEGMPIQPICVEGEGATLKLYDKDDNSGTITGALSTAGGVDVRNGGTFHMYGGTVTGNTSTEHGGGVRVRNNATFYLYGGTIENNKTQNMGGYGGGVHVEADSSFYMSGGSIQNNTAFAAAGVYIGTNCAFYMSGGSITGNTATNGEGGVLFTNDGTATFKLSGDVTISDNVTKIDIEEIDVHETYPSNMVIPDSVTIEVVGALTGEGKIYVQIGTSRVFTNSTGSVKAKDYIDKFVSDSATYRIRTEGDELKIEAPHLRVGGTFVYDDNAADVFKDGKVKFTPANETTTYATLTLNGYQYDGTADDDSEGIIYLDSAQLRIVLQGENIVKATNPGIMINREADTIISSENGGSLEVVSKQGDAIYANGELTIESGTISATGGNRGIAANGIHLNGGKIAATGTGERGYGIYCDNLPWLPANSVGINSGISSLVASGTLGAVYGNATNALEGFGWSNAEGTEGREAIAVTAEARSLEYKKVAFVSHTHGFTYSASGATITATCDNADGGCMLTDNKATLTIAAPDNLTYDKSAKAAVITDANAIQGTAKVQYQTKSGDAYGEATETAPTNAGTYKASITVGGATASVEYTIAKADPTCTAPTGLTATYGQTLADVTLTNPDGNTPGTWTWADDTQSVGNVVSPAATFKANFTPTSSNYKTVENVDVAVTVNKANQTAPAAPTEAGKTINSITLNEIPNGEYKCGAGDWQTSPTFTGLAQNTSYTFRQRYAEDANHNASAGSEEAVIRTNNHSHEWSFSATGATITATCTGTGTCSLTNNQISVTLVAPEGNPVLVYDGTNHVATLDGAEAFNAATGMNVSAADIVYNYKATSSESAAVVTETKNAGIYQALYTLQTPTSPKPFVGISFTVYKADPIATAPTATATYGQTLADVTLTNPTGNTAGTWAFVDDATTSVGGAGSHTFKANFTPTDTTNYNTVSNADVTVTVGKANPTATAPTATATYGQTLANVTLTNPTGNTAGTWAFVDDATTSVGGAGSHTFKANFTPTDTTNYNTVSNADVTVTVAPASVTLTANSGTETYDTTEKTVEGFTCSVDGLTFDGVAATVSATNAGIYDITFSGVVLNETKDTTGNYVVTGTTDGTLTVNPASVTLTANSGTETYDGTEKTVEGFTASVEGLTFTGVTASASGTDADEYDVTFTGVTVNTTKDATGNYVVTGTTDGKLTIEKAPLIVKALDQSMFVNTALPDFSAPELNVHYSVNGLIGSDTLTAPPVLAYQKDGEPVDPETNKAGTYDIVPAAAVADNYEIAYENGTLSIRNRSTGGVSGETTPTTEKTYTPTLLQLQQGKIAVSSMNSKANEKVTVTITPDEGYVVDTVTVKDANGKEIPVTKNPDGTYTYTQPESDVTVEATYKEKEPSQNPTPADTTCPKDATCPMAAFTDLDAKLWYHDGIHYCLEKGMMNGVGDGKFDPSGATSRAMIVTILYRMEGSPAVTAANPFTDVEAGKWYTDAVIWAAENKIVEGYGNGKFGPNDQITREQLAAILYRCAQAKGQGFTGAWMFNLDYPDAAAVSSWANEAMHWCVMNEIINGKNGKLVPGGDASRAEAATMLMRYCTKS